MSKDQDPADVLQQFIEKNKDAISQVSFGGGTKNKLVNHLQLPINNLIFCLFFSIFYLQFFILFLVMGYCSGMAFRRVGRAVGLVIGVGAC